MAGNLNSGFHYGILNNDGLYYHYFYHTTYHLSSKIMSFYHMLLQGRTLVARRILTFTVLSWFTVLSDLKKYMRLIQTGEDCYNQACARDDVMYKTLAYISLDSILAPTFYPTRKKFNLHLSYLPSLLIKPSNNHITTPLRYSRD